MTKEMKKSVRLGRPSTSVDVALLLLFFNIRVFGPSVVFLATFLFKKDIDLSNFPHIPFQEAKTIPLSLYRLY